MKFSKFGISLRVESISAYLAYQNSGTGEWGIHKWNILKSLKFKWFYFQLSFGYFWILTHIRVRWFIRWFFVCRSLHSINDSFKIQLDFNISERWVKKHYLATFTRKNINYVNNKFTLIFMVLLSNFDWSRSFELRNMKTTF